MRSIPIQASDVMLRIDEPQGAPLYVTTAGRAKLMEPQTDNFIAKGACHKMAS